MQGQGEGIPSPPKINPKKFSHLGIAAGEAKGGEGGTGRVKEEDFQRRRRSFNFLAFGILKLIRHKLERAMESWHAHAQEQQRMEEVGMKIVLKLSS